ncbi:MAG: flagellar biosynthetic protein FliR [Planctomycetaceae bacterium]
MIETFVIATVLVLLRVASFVALLPPFAAGGLPKSVKLGLAVALTCVWGPLHAPDAWVDVCAASLGEHAWLVLGWMAGREVMIGAGLAWLLGLVFVPFRIAGSYLAQEMGLTMAALASPVDQQSSSIVSQFIEGIATLLFFAVDAPHLLFRVFARCLESLPVGQPITLPGPAWIVSCVSRVEAAGLELAAPVAAGLFLTTALLAFLMRWAPQFNLLTFGTAFRLLAGLVLLLLLLPDLVNRMTLLLQHWGNLA